MSPSEFFSSLESFLNRRLPRADELRRAIPQIVAQSKESSDVHKRFPEGALLNHYITPGISDFLTSVLGLSEVSATYALLSESFRNLEGIASASPARGVAHPFRKMIGASTREVWDSWSGNAVGSAVSRSAPDIALRGTEVPCTVLFEGKYFHAGGLRAAQTELVKDLYQTFFYLGLSKLAETETHPAWDYDYACLVAFDASPEQSLKSAWDNLNPEVRTSFWDGANIHVMVLTGEC